MQKEKTKDMLRRISREIAQLGEDLIVRSRVVVKGGMATLKTECFRRVDNSEESSPQQFGDNQDDRVDGAPHNID